MTIFPQVLKNVEVTDKNSALSNPQIIEAIEQAEQKMNGVGRILVRPSGTESLVRVMVEAESEADCEKYADEIVHVIEDIIEIGRASCRECRADGVVRGLEETNR